MFNFKTQGSKHNKNKGQGNFHSVGQGQEREQSLNEKFNQSRQREEEFDMEGFKHQLAKISAVLAWFISIYFSYEGFAFQNTSALWIGYLLAFLVTCGELIFNTELKKLSLTLVAIGIICYGYGTYSSVLGFWSFQFPSEDFVWNSNKSLMSWFVGAFLEVYPEAAFAWGMKALTGDLVGNIVSLGSGAITGQRRTFRMDTNIKDRIGH